tara:strand:+ start:1081 stop:1431 length:351 start_codon:yes stop_codon:yes gene_type:complete
MKHNFKKKPRIYTVGKNKDISISDLGKIHLEANEQLTFVTENKNEYDFCRKNWGFYATPSINSRLKNENFVTALVSNEHNRIFIMVVEKSMIKKFRAYLKDENQTVVTWFGDDTVR